MAWFGFGGDAAGEVLRGRCGFVVGSASASLPDRLGGAAVAGKVLRGLGLLRDRSIVGYGCGELLRGWCGGWSLTSLPAFSEAAARRQWQGWTDCYWLGPPRVCVLGLGSIGLGSMLVSGGFGSFWTQNLF